MQRLSAPALMAAALALPSLALAQSNVTVYGLIDLNVGYEKSGSQHYEGVGHGELNGSRLGFRGTEDLGNGNKALFVLESGFDPSAGLAEQGGAGGCSAASPSSVWRTASAASPSVGSTRPPSPRSTPSTPRATPTAAPAC